MKDRGSISVAIALAGLVIALLAYIAGYFLLATPTDIGAAVFRVYPAQWIARAYQPLGHLEGMWSPALARREDHPPRRQRLLPRQPPPLVRRARR
jgi:hypothetical protein